MDDHAIAIIGMTFRLPGADSFPRLWSNLENGRVSIRHFQREDCLARGLDSPLFDHPRYVFADAALPDIDLFDADFFAFSQREAQLLDPQQRILLECAWELLETTGYGHPVRRPRIGVYAGASMNTYLPNVIGSRCDLMSPAGTELMLTNDKDYLCGRISYKLGLNGPSVAVQTGCSTALSGIHCAVQSLLCGECDIALAGGVSIQAVLRPGYLYEPNLMFSPDGMCRPFDSAASGTVFGDGAGLVALRPLREAKDCGDSILAVILGSAMNNEGDGRLGFTAPGVSGQRRLIAEAQSVAGVGPDDIGMIEAHGTGTALGDPVEFAALCDVFGRAPRRTGRCALGSIKANVGHLAAAAGMAGLARAILALKHAVIPPHPTFSRANPSLGLENSPFIINREAIPWPTSGTRRAGISSFGAGGSNVHLVLAEGPPRAPKCAGVGLRAIPLSASDPDRLKALAAGMAEHIDQQPDISLDDMAVTLSEGRAVQACKTLFYARDAGELSAQLKAGGLTIATAVAAPRLIVIVGHDMSYDCAANHPVFNRELTALLAWINERHPAIITREDVLARGCAEAGAGDLARGIGALAYLLMWRHIIDSPLLLLAEPDSGRGAASGVFSVADIVHGMASSRAGPYPPERADLPSLLGDYLALSPDGTPAFRQLHTEAGYFSARLINRGDQVFIPAHRGSFAAKARQLCLDRGAAAMVGPAAGDMPAMLRCVGDMWCRGVAINWHGLCRHPGARRIPLPVQPLRRRRCWYAGDPGEAQARLSSMTPSAGGLSPPVVDDRPRLYVERWRRIGRCAVETDIAGPCRRLLLVEPGCPMAGPLMDGLKNRGGNLTAVAMGPGAAAGPGGYCLDSHDPRAGERLADALRKDNLMPDHLLLLFGGDGKQEPDVAGPIPYAVFILLELAKAFSLHRQTPLVIDLIGPGFADVLGDEAVSPERAAAWAACHSLMQEIPHVLCHCIDVAERQPPLPADVQDVMAEITGARRPSMIALRNGWRWQRYFETFEPVAAPADRHNLTCLVTGGLGRVGFQLARCLAAEHQARLVLLTRTPLAGLPENDRRRERLRELRAIAAAVEVINADIADIGQVGDALHQAEQRIGPVNCFIHAAGLSGPAALHWVQKSAREQWQTLLRPTFIGASVLHALLGRRRLRFGYFTSSLAAHAGGLGLAAYSAANEACAAFALGHGRRYPYLIIDWDGWRGWDTGGSFTYGAARARPLTGHEAGAIFTIALDNMQECRLAVSTRPPGERWARHPPPPPPAPGDIRGDEPCPAGAPAADIIEELTAIWREVLQCEVDKTANFFDLGGDSLVGAELVRRINARFNCMLTMVDLFEAATVDALAAKISRAPAAPVQQSLKSEGRAAAKGGAA